MHFIRRLFAIFAFLAIAIGQARSQSSISTFRNGHDNFSTERNHHHDSIICMDIYPQRSMDMKQLMGKWYGNEIIIHSQDVPGVFQYDSCVIIHISDVTDQMQNHFYNDYRRTSVMQQQHDPTRQQQQYHQQRQFREQQQQQHYQQEQNHEYDLGMRHEAPKFLRLLWTERDDTLEYIFNYTSDNPGRWTNVGEQRGSFVQLNHYTQFSGTVQVAKTTNNHLVLTFCGNDLKSTIYTIVLSRRPQGMDPQDIHNIRASLSSRQLPVETIRKICSSAAASLRVTMATTVLLLLAVMVVVDASIFRKH